MIQKADISCLLLEACPSFAPTWQEFVEQWKAEPEPPLYLALADFSRHVISLLARNDIGRFPAIFSVIERMHIEGDSYVKEAAAVGLLESLQNTNLHESTEPDQFRCYLGEASEKWWDKLYDFWENGKLLSDD
jgi:hypothetical protein